MYRRVAQRLTLRIAIALTICTALLSVSGIPLLTTGAAQAPREERKVKPKPGKPEGIFPDLEDIKQESRIEREAPPPIPSTIRSPKSPLQPWNGKRVGDPGTRGESGQSVARNNTGYHRIRRAHAPKPPPLLDDQFVQSFFNAAVVRAHGKNLVDQRFHCFAQLQQ